MRDIATRNIMIHDMTLKMLFIYFHRQYVVSMLRPVCALGKEDKHRSEYIFAIVMNSSCDKEQNGLGKLIENLRAAKPNPNNA